MKEQEWLAGSQPGRMFQMVRERASERQVRSFALACCRRHLGLDGSRPDEDPAELVLRLAEWWVELGAGCPRSSALLPFVESWAFSRARPLDPARLGEKALDLMVRGEYDERALDAPEWEVVQLALLWNLYFEAYPDRHERGQPLYEMWLRLRAPEGRAATSARERAARWPLLHEASQRAADLLPLFQVQYCCPQCSGSSPGGAQWADLHRAVAADLEHWLPDWVADEEEQQGDGVPSREEVLSWEPARLELLQWRREQGELLQDVFGNPFRPAAIDTAWTAWEGGAVRKLAQTIHDERAFDQMPVLGDALEDAGCRERQILQHCRQRGRHVRGCWLLDRLLSVP
jgi:hypothetical protein